MYIERFIFLEQYVTYMENMMKVQEDATMVNFEDVPVYFSKSYYIRQAYKELYKLTNFSSSDFLITGNPGIGKTVFLEYFLMRYLKMNKPILLIKGAQKTYIYFEPKKNKVVVTFDSRSLRVQEIPLVLIDTATHQSQIYRFTGRMIMVSSPGVPNQDFLKRDNTKLLKMPIWKFEEICEAKAQTLSLGEVTDRFNKFGGIPRILFEEDSKRYSYFCMVQGYHMTNSTLSMLKKLKSEDEGEVSHTIVHNIVEKCYVKSRLEFASEFVRKHVYLAICENDEAGKKRMLDVSSDIPLHLFKTLTRHLLLTHGIGIFHKRREVYYGNKEGPSKAPESVTSGGATSELSENLSKLSLKEQQYPKFFNYDEFQEKLQSDSRYLVPEMKVFPADLVQTPNILFIMTTDATPCVVYNDLRKAITCFNQSVNYYLYFVVSDRLFESIEYVRLVTNTEQQSDHENIKKDLINRLKFYVVTL